MFALQKLRKYNVIKLAQIQLGNYKYFLIVNSLELSFII